MEKITNSELLAEIKKEMGDKPEWHSKILAPDPTRELGSALQFVEEMRSAGIRPILMPDWGSHWQVILYQEAGLINGALPWCGTIEEAICHAWLFWKRWARGEVEQHDPR